MERRRLQLANSHDSGGGTSLEFPIYLVEGDNGQVGVDLYNYVIENTYTDNWGDVHHKGFNSDEEVYFSAYGITEKISSFGIREGFVVYSMPQFGGSTLLLYYTGNVIVNWS